jgi:hypothetical protein
MLMGDIVVEHRVDRLAGRDFALDGVEEADEIEVAGALAVTVPSITLSAANRVVVPRRL